MSKPWHDVPPPALESFHILAMEMLLIRKEVAIEALKVVSPELKKKFGADLLEIETELAAHYPTHAVFDYLRRIRDGLST